MFHVGQLSESVIKLQRWKLDGHIQDIQGMLVGSNLTSCSTSPTA